MIRSGIAQWLERWTRDWNIVGMSHHWSIMIILFSRVSFLCWLLFWYLFHPYATAVARKRSQSFCQKCRWQITAKHTYTLHKPFEWRDTVNWCTVVWSQNMCRDGSSFMWHQPCNNQMALWVHLLDGGRLQLNTHTHCVWPSNAWLYGVEGVLWMGPVGHSGSHVTWVQWVCLRAENRTI